MKYLKLVLLVALCGFAVACTATKQNAATTEASTEWRMQSLEESFLNFREEQRKQADATAEALADMEKKLAALEAKSGGNEQAVMDAPVELSEVPQDKGWVTDLKPEEDKWVDGGKDAEGKKAVQSDEEKPWNKPPTPAAIPEPKVIDRTPAPKKMAAKKPAPKKPMKSSSQTLYNAGLNKYYANDFKGARTNFDSFMKKYPKSNLIPNALYWKGETYYSEKDYAQAILTFKEVTGKYGKHSKAPDALLKIGMSYEMVGDSDNAVFYLRALVEDFPSSSAAKRARTELKRLGG